MFVQPARLPHISRHLAGSAQATKSMWEETKYECQLLKYWEKTTTIGNLYTFITNDTLHIQCLIVNNDTDLQWVENLCFIASFFIYLSYAFTRLGSILGLSKLGQEWSDKYFPFLLIVWLWQVKNSCSMFAFCHFLNMKNV